MTDEEREGLELLSDWAAFYEAWPLVLKFKWRMISREQGGTGLAWPQGDPS
jgi:hypothetical protein